MARLQLANSGLDTLDGLTEFTPWQTVAKVVSSSAAADLIRLQRTCLWREFANPLPTGQSWDAYGVGERPEITAFDVVSGTFTATTPTSTFSIAWTPSIGTVTAVRVNGAIYTPAANQAALIPGQFFWAANVLYLCITGGSVSMAGFLIEANGNRAQAFTPGNGKGSYTLKNFWLSGGTNVTALFQTQASPSTFAGMKFSHGGITTGVGLLYFAAVGVAGHVVVNCDFRDGICDHLYAADSPSCSVSYCTFINFYGSLSDHLQMSGSAGGSGGWENHHNYHYVQPASGSLKGCSVLSSTTSVGGCSVHDNFFVGGNYAFSWGNPTDTGNDNHLVFRNVAFGQTGALVGAFGCGCACSGAQWTYNVGAGLAYHGLSLFNGKTRTGAKIYHNTLLSATRGLSSAAVGDLLDGDARNNIIVGAPGNSDLVIRGVPGGGALTLDFNWYGPERTNFLTWAGVNYSTLAPFKGASGQEANGRAQDAMLSNPGYADTPLRANESVDQLLTRWRRNLQPDASSPAIGTAVPIASVNDDQGARPTVGAIPWTAEPKR